MHNKAIPWNIEILEIFITASYFLYPVFSLLRPFIFDVRGASEYMSSGRENFEGNFPLFPDNFSRGNFHLSKLFQLFFFTTFRRVYRNTFHVKLAALESKSFYSAFNQSELRKGEGTERTF